MAIYYNPNTYDIGAASPIDSRFTRQTNALRDAMPSAVRYEGLTVYVADPAGNGSIPATTYTLVGGILNTDWTTSSLIAGLWGIVGGVIQNVGVTDVAVTTSLIVPKLKPSANGVTAIQLTQANGTTVIVNLDTTNNRLGINNIAPEYDLDITGSARATGTIYGSALQGDSLTPVTAGSYLTISTRPGSAQAILFKSTGTTPTETMRLTTDGRLGFGVSVPTAQIHIAAGTATANTAPIKLTSGTLLASPEPGVIEFLTDAYYVTTTTGPTRKQLAYTATTLAGYGITDAVLKAGDTMTGALQIGVAADNKLILQHNYTTTPAGASYIKWMDESSSLLATIGLAPTTKALTLTSNTLVPLIVLNSVALATSGVQFVDSSTTITRDGSNNIVFTDAVSGSKTLAALLAGDTWTASGADIYNSNAGNVGIGGAPTTGFKLDVQGILRTTGKFVSQVSGSVFVELEAKSASGYKWRVYDVTNSINLLHINASGYVGINTNAQADQFGVVANTSGIYAGNFTNSHITGKGLYVAGGSTTQNALYVGDYQGTSLFEVLGSGTAKSQRLLLSTTATPITSVAGLLQWDSTYQSVSLGLDANVAIRLGLKEVRLVYNATGSTIPSGSYIYETGVHAGSPDVITVALAIATSSTTAFVLGCATENILNGSYGFVAVRGDINSLNTSIAPYNAMAVGDMLYLSDTVAGSVTNTVPADPSVKVRVGRLVTKDATSGTINVRLTQLYNLDYLGDVTITSPTVGQVLKSNGTAWINQDETTTGFSEGIGFYLDDTNIIPSGTQSVTEINTLVRVPNTIPEVVDSIAANVTTALGESYLYNTPMGRTQLDGGVWTFNLYCAVDTAAGTSTLTARVNKAIAGTGTITTTGTGTTRTATASTGTPFAVATITVGGTLLTDSFLRTTTGLFRILSRLTDQQVTIETLSTYTNQAAVAYSTYVALFTATTTQINNLYAGGPGLALKTVVVTQPAYTIGVADTISIMMLATTTSNRIVYYSHNGFARYSSFITPLFPLHNDLPGLQGGGANEDYHLTNAQHTIAIQAASSSLDGYLTHTDWSTFNNNGQYSNATPTPVTIGGIAAGSTFTSQTMKQMFDALLYPYQTPVFYSFALTGQATTLECGIYALGGSQTFTWGTTNSSNVQVNSLVIKDYTTSTTLGSGLANTGTSTLAIGSAVTNTATNAVHQWSLDGTNTNSVAMATTYFTVTWYSPFYYGVGAAALSVANLQALTKQVVAKANHTYTFNPTSQKMYYAYPASYGTLTSIIDPNGFNITADWTLSTPTFTNNPTNYNGGSVTYNVYEYNNLTTQTSFNVIFNF